MQSRRGSRSVPPCLRASVVKTEPEMEKTRVPKAAGPPRAAGLERAPAAGRRWHPRLEEAHELQTEQSTKTGTATTNAHCERPLPDGPLFRATYGTDGSGYPDLTAEFGLGDGFDDF